MSLVVYRIRNIRNARYYIGSTNNFEVRKAEHLGGLRSGKHPNIFLQRDFIEWGESSFEFTVLFDDFNTRERMLLKEYELILKAGKQAYNIDKVCPIVSGRKKSKSPKYGHVLKCRYVTGQNKPKKARPRPIKKDYPIIDSIIERKAKRLQNQNKL